MAHSINMVKMGTSNQCQFWGVPKCTIKHPFYLKTEIHIMYCMYKIWYTQHFRSIKCELTCQWYAQSGTNILFLLLFQNEHFDPITTYWHWLLWRKLVHWTLNSANQLIRVSVNWVLSILEQKTLFQNEHLNITALFESLITREPLQIKTSNKKHVPAMTF